MKIYISLPIDTPGFDINIQRRTALKWQKHFEELGQIVSNPFEIYDRLVRFHKDAKLQAPTREQIMAEDLSELITNDSIFMCYGWELSLGCSDEFTLAKSMNLHFIYEKDYEPTRTV